MRKLLHLCIAVCLCHVTTISFLSELSASFAHPVHAKEGNQTAESMAITVHSGAKYASSDDDEVLEEGQQDFNSASKAWKVSIKRGIGAAWKMVVGEPISSKQNDVTCSELKDSFLKALKNTNVSQWLAEGVSLLGASPQGMLLLVAAGAVAVVAGFAVVIPMILTMCCAVLDVVKSLLTGTPLGATVSDFVLNLYVGPWNLKTTAFYPILSEPESYVLDDSLAISYKLKIIKTALLQPLIDMFGGSGQDSLPLSAAFAYFLNYYPNFRNDLNIAVWNSSDHEGLTSKVEYLIDFHYMDHVFDRQGLTCRLVPESAGLVVDTCELGAKKTVLNAVGSDLFLRVFKDEKLQVKVLKGSGVSLDWRYEVPNATAEAGDMKLRRELVQKVPQAERLDPSTMRRPMQAQGDISQMSTNEAISTLLVSNSTVMERIGKELGELVFRHCDKAEEKRLERIGDLVLAILNRHQVVFTSDYYVAFVLGTNPYGVPMIRGVHSGVEPKFKPGCDANATAKLPEGETAVMWIHHSPKNQVADTIAFEVSGQLEPWMFIRTPTQSQLKVQDETGTGTAGQSDTETHSKGRNTTTSESLLPPKDHTATPTLRDTPQPTTVEPTPVPTPEPTTAAPKVTRVYVTKAANKEVWVMEIGSNGKPQNARLYLKSDKFTGGSGVNGFCVRNLKVDPTNRKIYWVGCGTDQPLYEARITGSSISSVRQVLTLSDPTKGRGANRVSYIDDDAEHVYFSGSLNGKSGILKVKLSDDSTTTVGSNPFRFFGALQQDDCMYFVTDGEGTKIGIERQSGLSASCPYYRGSDFSYTLGASGSSPAQRLVELHNGRLWYVKQGELSSVPFSFDRTPPAQSQGAKFVEDLTNSDSFDVESSQ